MVRPPIAFNVVSTKPDSLSVSVWIDTWTSIASPTFNAASTAAAADHGGHARHQRLVDLLRADEVDVRVDAAGGHDHALAGNDFGPGADGDVDPGLDVGVAGLAEAGDPVFLDRDIAFDDAPPVDHQRIGDDRVGAIFRHTLALAHAVADDFAAAKFDFFTVDREVLLDLDNQLGVGKAYPIADRWPAHFDIGAATDLHRFVPRSTSPADGGRVF